MTVVPLGLGIRDGVLDEVTVDPSGLIRISGWSQNAGPDCVPPALSSGDLEIPLHRQYRSNRPDVPASSLLLLRQTGIVFEYLMPRQRFADSEIELRIAVSGHEARSVTVPGPLHAPHYEGLLTTDEVWGRDRIYGYGPPMPEANPEFLALTAGLEGSVLDFGCGSGALVAALRGRGVDAHGIELDRGPIHEALRPDARPYVTLYDGVFPAPYPDGSFDTVVSSEVLEHIPDYQAAIAEIARISRRQAILTVPDMGILPLGARHGLLPWHLLESTHVNFFTQASLEACLRPHFARVEFGRMTPCHFNETAFHVSLVAVCER